MPGKAAACRFGVTLTELCRTVPFRSRRGLIGWWGDQTGFRLAVDYTPPSGDDSVLEYSVRGLAWVIGVAQCQPVEGAE